MLEIAQARPGGRQSPASFLTSLAVHAAVVLLLFTVTFPETRRILTYQVTPVFAPLPEVEPASPRHTPKPALRTPPPVRHAVVLQPVMPAPPPVIPAPRPQPLAVAPPRIVAPPPPAPRIEAPPSPEPRTPVKLGGFGSQTAEVAAAPPKQVAANPGGFASVAPPATGVPGAGKIQLGAFAQSDASVTGTAARAAQAAAAGFGEAVGAHTAAQTRGVAATTAGFGSAQAGAAPAPERAGVTGASFEQVAAAASPGRAQAAAETAARTELQILRKPRPAYTEEARRLHIEGDVILQALFTASGQIRVLRIVRGLGHGLDENAIAAATAIQFRPAAENGRPADVTATVHITFQLAD